MSNEDFSFDSSREPIHIQDSLRALRRSLDYTLPEHQEPTAPPADEVMGETDIAIPVIETRVDELRAEMDQMYSEYERTGDKDLLRRIDKHREEIFWRTEDNDLGTPLQQE